MMSSALLQVAPARKILKVSGCQIQRIFWCKCSRDANPRFLKAPLPKSYDPKYVESGWYKWWEDSGFFNPEYQLKSSCKSADSQGYVICLPPPNVTGSLHLGHTLTVAIQDSLIRWHRMSGCKTLWIPGCDHAGIATQVVVEKKLWHEQKKTRHNVGREKFLEFVWNWKHEKSGEIDNQLRRLGASLDWTRPNFTMDEKFSSAVREAFIRLHEEGLIYRSLELVNWSCALNSAISDIEVDQEPIPGTTLLSIPGYDEPVEFGVLTYFSYPVHQSDAEIVVATTRVETMLGDTAIAVNPTDPRYKHLIGQYAKHPFVERLLPIISDESVDQEFGTGAVKITPAHDHSDREIGRRHSLDVISVIDDSGHILSPAPRFQGLKRFDARNEITVALKEMGLYKGRKENPMVVPVCSRSKDIVEPLMKEQWFVDCKQMAESAVKAVEEGQLKIVPEMHIKTWTHWLNNIRDWCISRQLWWGHRIPAYRVVAPKKKEEKELWVSAHTETEAQEKAALRLGVNKDSVHLQQDEDVLDTWFSSGIFPFAVHGWPQQTSDLAQFYPSTLLETGHDILFFWVARMVMLGQKLTGVLPFHQIYLHSMVRDAHGRKMSKSLGNVIDPIDVIQGISLQGLHDKLDDGNMRLDKKELKKAKAGQRKDFPQGIPECGTDALRFALCTYKAQGEDVNLSVNQVQEYRFFCNKIWNAAKFTFSNLEEDFKPVPVSKVISNASIMDRWILSQLSHSCKIVNSAFSTYDFPVATTAINRFWIQNLCDVYLECVKPILRSDSPEAVLTCQTILVTSLEAGLRLLSPFMPFITEELFQRLPRQPGNLEAPSITVASYPTEKEFPFYDAELEEDVDLALRVVRSVRSLQAEFRIKNSKAHVSSSSDRTGIIVSDMMGTILTLSKCCSLSLLSTPPPGCLARAVSQDCIVYVEVKDSLDICAAVEKLERKKEKLRIKLEKAESLTGIWDYTTKVPEDVRQRNQRKIEDLRANLEKTESSVMTLKEMT